MILRFLDSLMFALERIWQHRTLVMWTLVGLTAATTLALSVVLYVDAVNNGLLASHLSDPPYGFRFRYLGSWNGNITQADVDAASAAVQAQFKDVIGLPVARSVSYARGGAWSIRTTGAKPLTLGAFSIGTLQGAEDQMTITAGTWEGISSSAPGAEQTAEPDTSTPTETNTPTETKTPLPTRTPAPTRTPLPTRTPVPGATKPPPTRTPLPTRTPGPTRTPAPTRTPIAGATAVNPIGPNEVIPVLVSEKMLYNMGVKVGDTLTATRPGGKPVTLRIAALWAPTNANDTTWIFTPKFFDQIILVPPDMLWRLLDGVDKPVEEVAWSLVFDGSQVKTADVGGLLGSITDGLRDVTAVLPGIRMDVSPTDNLTAFNTEVTQLTEQLVIMILPVGGLVLYFVALVAGLLVSRQQAEDAKLSSRGMSRGAILGLHVRVWLILAGTALVMGIILSPLVVRLVGQTTSFLRFDDVQSILVVTFTPQALAAGALTSLTAASTGLFLAWRSSRQTITGYKQSTGRTGQAWWQRMYLDVMLIVPAVYVLYTLWKQGGIVAAADDPFSNPLTFLAPTLFSFGVTLLFLRLWHVAMRLGAAVVSYTTSVPLMMAFRELSRSVGRYRGTLLMMGFTLSLTGFTASMASTLDRSLKDAMDYRIGADIVAVTVSDATTSEGSTDANGQTSLNVTGFNTLPADDLMTIDGVADVSRVGHYPGRLVLANQRIDGTIVGIDRAAIAAVTRSRADYASQPFADLFNKLAGNRTGVLVNAVTMQKYNLKINQEIDVQISALNTWYDMKVPIVGAINYFPTLDPNAGFFMIANIDPLFEAVGTPLPYDFWLSLKPGTNPGMVHQAALKLGYPILQWLDPQVALAQAQGAPSRRGVLGFLSVGFIASIVLTLVGAIIQTTASFRAQSLQLGSLRAMGLGGGAVGRYLTMVQGIAASSGIASGTTIGVGTTLLFLPLLDFSGGLPPYLVRVAWSDIMTVYLVFAGILFFVTIVMTIALGRESLAAVVKLGDV